MARLDLTYSHFEDLLKNGYSLDMIFILKLIHKEKCNIKDLCADNPKISVIYQTLVRKGLISEDSKVLLQGKSILDFLSTPLEEKKFDKKETISDDKFSLWWSSFPGTDTFTHKGVSFSGSRSLKINRDECKIRLTKILEEGEYTIDQLVDALKFDVLQKKENSVKHLTNKLSYMQGSLTYLNQRSYEPFIELINEGQKVVETTVVQGGTDI